MSDAQTNPLPEPATTTDTPAETAHGEATPLGLPAKLAMAALAVLALAALFWPRGESSFEAPGGFLVDDGGRPVTLATRLAPVTLVHFWATWCPPCLQEVPALSRLAEDFADEPDFDIVMIAVADELQDVEPFLGSLAPMALFDPSWEVANRYGTEKLPETYLVVNGRVIEVPSQARIRRESGLKLDGDKPRWVGQIDWDDEGVRRELRELLETVRSPT